MRIGWSKNEKYQQGSQILREERRGEDLDNSTEVLRESGGVNSRSGGR